MEQMRKGRAKRGRRRKRGREIRRRGEEEKRKKRRRGGRKTRGGGEERRVGGGWSIHQDPVSGAPGHKSLIFHPNTASRIAKDKVDKICLIYHHINLNS